MDNNSKLLELDHIHQKANQALASKDIKSYLKIFSDSLKYTNADAEVLTKKLFADYIENQAKITSNLTIEQYRIKSSFEDDVVVEKIAKKSVSKVKTLLLFSKKQTIQTEETIKWKHNGSDWEIFELEITLEEKY